ncbi:MAG: bifunctional adenosylcobinamide kinase/adenosylcobinamide-phosphate guanylyltransferase [Lachnospiraceae bacterium]|nr:bifunctional adenosylcobinamide kinase/adenosylcobinamide-phosphate guanylyltransferase [Lachnospiraceae bacterium]MCM1279471.1 bifunctional adenosylcobinamide kinase/adenosylcobinamide-phosphate guanylyltransferase [Robinsoniella sp.]
MELYIGGKGQGKLFYVCRRLGLKEQEVLEGSVASVEEALACKAVNHFHLFIKKVMEEGGDALEVMERLAKINSNMVIICDEIGCGIVPLEKKERDYREMVGRTMCLAAKKADRVVRIVAGLPWQIK